MIKSWVEAVFGDLEGHGSQVSSAEPVRLELLPVERLVADMSRDVTPKTVEELMEDRLKRAYQNGYEDGLRQGETQAQAEMAQVKESLSQKILLLNGAISRLESLVAHGFEERVGEIAQFALEIAESVMHMTPDLEQRRLEIVLRDVFKEIPPGRTLVVRVHSSMFLFVKEIIDQYQRGSYHDIKVVEDDSVDPVGAVVEEGATTLDLQLRTAKARVREVLNELRGVRE
jgi:flagellar biosynthesis/type III secretory pathway protein FliH